MSKFLRQMTALSKKPSDYTKRGGPVLVEPSANTPPTVVETPTVITSPTPEGRDEPPTVVETPTVVDTVSPIALNQHQTRISETPYPNPRARFFRATLVQDGHSLGEQAIYDTLWRLASGSGREFRTVAIGYDRLAAAARLNEKSVRDNIKSLISKLAVEVTAAEQSATRQGKTYRIYGFETILARRKAAGMEWVIKNKGVRFVPGPTSATPTVGLSTTVVASPTAVPITTEGQSPTGSVVETPTHTVGVSTGASILEKTTRHLIGTSSSSNYPVITDTAARFGVLFDDDAVRKLTRRCRESDEHADEAEIAYFLAQKCAQLKGRRNIENPVGMLLASVPLYFSPPHSELTRYRAAQMSAQRESREGDNTLLQQAQTVLDDPTAAVADKELAQAVLGDPKAKEGDHKLARELLDNERGAGK